MENKGRFGAFMRNLNGGKGSGGRCGGNCDAFVLWPRYDLLFRCDRPAASSTGVTDAVSPAVTGVPQ